MCGPTTGFGGLSIGEQVYFHFVANVDIQTHPSSTMASRSAPTPDPGIAAEMGQNAIASVVVTGLLIPILQYVAWEMLVEIPATTSLQQPPNAWLYLFVLGLFPALIFVEGLLKAAGRAGWAGVAAYFVMSIAASSLFTTPMLSVMMILGSVFALALFLLLRTGGY